MPLLCASADVTYQHVLLVLGQRWCMHATMCSSLQEACRTFLLCPTCPHRLSRLCSSSQVFRLAKVTYMCAGSNGPVRLNTIRREPTLPGVLCERFLPILQCCSNQAPQYWTSLWLAISTVAGGSPHQPRPSDDEYLGTHPHHVHCRMLLFSGPLLASSSGHHCPRCATGNTVACTSPTNPYQDNLIWLLRWLLSRMPSSWHASE